MTAVQEVLIPRGEWQPVCRTSDVPPGQGVAALVAGQQVAIFRTDSGAFHALGNRDPFTGANVMSRGILGCRGGVPTVASPMLKHAFELETGRSLADPGVTLPRYDIRVLGDIVDVAVPPW